MNYPFSPQATQPFGGSAGIPTFPSMTGAIPTAPGSMPGLPEMQVNVPGAFPVPSGFTPGPVGQQAPVGPAVPGGLPLEESYIENILRLNLGKIATIYMTFENNSQWNAKVFRGRLEAAGRDHIIISDPVTGMRYLLLMVNLDYITFDQPLNYFYPFQGATAFPLPTGAAPSSAPMQ